MAGATGRTDAQRPAGRRFPHRRSKTGDQMTSPKPTNPPALRLKITSDPATLASTRRAVEMFAAQCGFDETARGEIGLVINEALANVMRHAYQGATDQPIEVA